MYYVNGQSKNIITDMSRLFVILIITIIGLIIGFGLASWLILETLPYPSQQVIYCFNAKGQCNN